MCTSVVLGQENDFDSAADGSIVIDRLGDVIDELDNQLSQSISGGSLAGKENVRGTTSRFGLAWSRL